MVGRILIIIELWIVIMLLYRIMELLGGMP